MIINKRKILLAIYNLLPSFLYPIVLKKIYYNKMGKKLNLRNPKLFTEKIQWLKLNDNLPIKTTLADKILVRKWAQALIPELKFPQIYTIADSFDALEFDKCPQNFLIKTNHAWKQNYIVKGKDKFFADEKLLHNTKLFFAYYLSKHFAFESGFELQYKNIKRKIYVEEIIGECDSLLNLDYKVYCFNGQPKVVEHYTVKMKDKSAYMVCWDEKGNRINCGNVLPLSEEKKIPLPVCFEKLLEYSKILSKEFKFVRVDFLVNDDKIYLSEMTFTPSSGFIFFQPEYWNEILGDMLELK